MGDASNDDTDIQALLLAMNNAIAAILRTHPNPGALRDALAELDARQAAAFEREPAPPALREAYARYSTNFAAIVSARLAPLHVNPAPDIRLK